MNPTEPIPSVRPRLVIPFLLVALPLAAAGPGTPRWTRFDPGQSWIGTAVATDGRIVAAANPASGSGPGKLIYLGSDGSLLRDLPSPRPWIRPPMLRDDGAAVLVRDDRLLDVFAENGDLLWARFFRGAFAAPVAMPDLGIAVGTEAIDPSPRRLWAVDAAGNNASVTDLGSVFPAGVAVPLNVVRSGDGIVAAPSPGSVLSLVDIGANWSRSFYSGTGGIVGLAPGPDLGFYTTDTNGLARITSDARAVWNVVIPNLATAALVTPDGLVLVGQSDGGLRAFSADGKPAWSVDVPGGVESTPAIASDGTIVFGGNDGHLRAVGPTGNPRWDFDAGSPIKGPINLLPNGDVLAGTIDGHLHCIEGSAPLATTGWPKWQGDAANSGVDRTPATVPPAPSGVTATDRASVDIAWNPAAGARRHEIWRSTTNVFGTATRIAVIGTGPFHDRGFATGVTNYYWVRGANGLGTSPEGTPAGILPTRRLWNIHPFSFLSGIAELHDGRLVASGNNASNTATVVAINPDGSISWTWSAPGNGSFPTPPLVDDDGNIVAGSGTFFVTLSPDGNLVSSIDTKVRQGGPIALGSGGIVYCAIGEGFGGFMTVNRTTGTFTTGIATGYEPDPAVATLAILRNGNSILDVGGRIDVLAPAGIRAWKTQVFGRTLLPGNRLLLVGRTNAAIVGIDGNPIRPVPLPPVRLTPNYATPGLGRSWNAGVVASDGTAWFPMGYDIVRMAPDGTTSVLAPLPTAAGLPQSMGLGTDGRLVVGRGSRVDVIGTDGSLVETLFGLGDDYYDGALPLLLSASGRLYGASDSGTITCVSMPFGLDTTAFWPLYRRDARGTSSIAEPVTTPPPAVSQPFAVALPDGNRLHWSISGDLVVQEVLRGTNADPAHATVIATLGAGAAQFDDTNNIAGAGTRYWIRTSNAIGATLTPGVVEVFPTPALVASIPTGNPYAIPGLALDDAGQVFESNNGNLLQSWHPDGTAAWVSRYAGAAEFSGTAVLVPGGGLVVSNPVTSVGAARDGSGVGPTQARSLLVLLSGGRAIYRDRDGSLHWYDGATRGSDLSLPDGGVLFPVAPADGTLLALTSSWEVARIDAAGHELGRSPLARSSTNFIPVPDAAIGIDGSLAIVTGSSGITMLNADGTTRWERPEEGLEPVLGEDGAVLVRFTDPDGRSRMHALDPAKGTTRWAFGLADAFGPAIAVADGSVVIATGTILWGLDGANGAPRWAFDVRPASERNFFYGISGTRLSRNGVLAVQKVLGDLRLFQLPAGPAASGWPMTRHDSGNTGFQGSGGDVAARWQRVATNATDPGELRFSAEDGRRFVPLVSDDLIAWRYLEQPQWSDEPDAGTQGPVMHSVLRVKIPDASTGRFVRAVSP